MLLTPLRVIGPLGRCSIKVRRQIGKSKVYVSLIFIYICALATH